MSDIEPSAGGTSGPVRVEKATSPPAKAATLGTTGTPSPPPPAKAPAGPGGPVTPPARAPGRAAAPPPPKAPAAPAKKAPSTPPPPPKTPGAPAKKAPAPPTPPSPPPLPPGGSGVTGIVTDIPCELAGRSLASLGFTFPPLFSDAGRVSALGVAVRTYYVSEEVGAIRAVGALVDGFEDGTYDFCDPVTLDALWCLRDFEWTPAEDRLRWYGSMLGLGPFPDASAPIPALLAGLDRQVAIWRGLVGLRAGGTEAETASREAIRLLQLEASRVMTGKDMMMTKQLAAELQLAMDVLSLPELVDRWSGPCGNGPWSVIEAVTQTSTTPVVNLTRPLSQAQAGFTLFEELGGTPGNMEDVDLAAVSDTFVLLDVARGKQDIGATNDALLALRP